MKIYGKLNVLDAAMERIRFLFDEFEEVAVGYSGGKDSTVTLRLALEVAKEKNRLPLKVVFIDQEAEWNETIAHMRRVMADPGVESMWYQMPLKILNATSADQNWLQCWEDGGDWIREKEPGSIRENSYGTDRFAELFTAIAKKDFAGKKFCYLAGVRCEESPGRFVGLTQGKTYKWITYGKKLADDKYTFYPLYDWSYTDIWKAIFDNKWEYNKVYDLMHRYGVKTKDMRVSNVHHETAVKSLFYLQELDPELYNKVTERIQGIDMAGKLNKEDYFVSELPYMFKDWYEYRDFLQEKLVTDKKFLAILDSCKAKWDETFAKDPANREKSAKIIIQSILANDLEGTKLHNHDVSFVKNYKNFYARLDKASGIRREVGSAGEGDGERLQPELGGEERDAAALHVDQA